MNQEKHRKETFFFQQMVVKQLNIWRKKINSFLLIYKINLRLIIWMMYLNVKVNLH